MTWQLGRGTILQMIQRSELERVPANREFADVLLTKAGQHLLTATTLVEQNPNIAFDALYTAARHALTVILVTQGLRPTSKGGHIAPIEAVRAQMGPAGERQLRPFDRLRRTRNRTDYPTPDSIISVDDVLEAVPRSEAIVALAAAVVPQLPVFVG